jgi:hypothetical protein
LCEVKVYEENKKKVPNANNVKENHIGPDKLNEDGILKTAIKGGKYARRNLDGRKLLRRRYTMIPVEKEERCDFRKIINFKDKYGLFYLSRYGSGCDHKGNSKNTNVKTSATHTTKSEIKTVKVMVQSPIKARGASSLLEKLTGETYTTKQVAHLMKKAQ